MQSVVWTYYGDDGTLHPRQASYGAVCSQTTGCTVHGHPAPGLSDSARCPAAGAFRWHRLLDYAIRALGYADTVVKFQTTAENLAKHELAAMRTRAPLRAGGRHGRNRRPKAAYTAAGFADLELGSPAWSC